jgi:LytS/YehU family sensor histidine kinase
VYRYILQSNTKDLVTVEEELMILESYFFMLKNRFRDAIDLNIVLSDKTRRSFIPPLTLQILVENCVKHNVLTQAKPLHVTISEEDNYIVIRNNLQIKNALESSNKLGLFNITQRYNHVNEYKVVVEKTPQYFTIKLPVLT